MMSAKLEMIGSDGSRCVADFGLEMRDRPSTDWRTLENVESAYTFSASDSNMRSWLARTCPPHRSFSTTRARC